MAQAGHDAERGSWLPGGATPRGVRNHNERLVLSTVRACGPLPGAEIARRTQLSAQTASVITRSLEADRLLRRGTPVRGRVGKPSVPMGLNPDGAYSFGLRIGRRRADLVLMDLTGAVRGRRRLDYAYPTPATVTAFVIEGVEDLRAGIVPERRDRIAGLGIGAPHQLWNWLDLVGAPRSHMQDWESFDFVRDLSGPTGLAVHLGNDATLACYGEQVFGTAAEKTNYAYFYIGAFVGGGIVLNGRVRTGPTGNAGALGSIVLGGEGGRGGQLIHNASLYVLEEMLEAQGRPAALARADEQSWDGFEDVLAPWLSLTARSLTAAAISVTAVLDVPAVVVDGGVPAAVRERLVGLIREEMAQADTRGVDRPEVLAGTLGAVAGALGSAHLPLAESYLAEGMLM